MVCRILPLPSALVTALLLLAVAGLALCPEPAHADIKIPETGDKKKDKKFFIFPKKDDEEKKEDDEGNPVVPERIPQPYPGKSVAVRGVPTRILLRAATNSTRQVEFLIRQEPRYGKLEGPIAVDGSAEAIVTYTAFPGRTEVRDAFKFAVRLPGEQVSLSVPVEIGITEPMPDIKVTPELNFGRVLVGKVRAELLRIDNFGRGAFAAELSFPEGGPWSADLPGGIVSVDAGKAVEIPILFRPDVVQGFRYSVEFEVGDQRLICQLSGEGIPPLIARPRSLQLTYDEETGARTGSVTIENLSEETAPLEVRVEPASLIASTAPAEIGPGAGVPIQVSAAADAAKGDLAGKIVAMRGDYSLEIPVKAAAVPAIIEVASGAQGGQVDFGTVDQGFSGSDRVLVVHNGGGVAAATKALIDPPFRADWISDAGLLVPGAKSRLKVSLTTTEIGEFARTLLLQFPGGEVRVPVRGRVSLPDLKTIREREREQSAALKPKALPRALENSVNQAGEALEALVMRVGATEVIREYEPEVPRVQAVKVERQRPTSLEICWDPPAAGLRYAMEALIMRYSPDHQKILPVWVPVDTVAIKEKDGKPTALLDGMSPASEIQIRFLSIDGEGRYSFPSPPFKLTTAAPGRGWLFYTLWGLGLIALGAGGFIGYKKWAADRV